jgi:membrane-bound ClpP family serine protease
MDPLSWALILLAAGFFVIFLELFIPSAGVLGIVAAVCLISGIVLGFMHSAMTGLTMMAGVLFSLPIMFAAMVKIWPHTPIGKRILIGPQAREDVVPTGDYYDEIQSLIGRLGVAKTKMLPSGIVIIDGKKYDALTDGLPVESGDTIKVAAIKGNRVIVSKFDGDPSDDGSNESGDILSRPLEELGLDDDPLS